MKENGHYPIEYEILNHQPNRSPRVVEVHATPGDIDRFAEEGVMLRERLFAGESLQELRDALDRLEEKERRTGTGTAGKRDFGGYFIRYLMDKEPAFLNLMRHQPLLSVARAMLGPQVQMAMSARISYPSPENQETIWHQHLRYIPKPLPPWAMLPQCMDALIYLDDVTDANGPLCVVPGTHRRVQEEPPANCYDDLPGQQILYPSAGTAVLMHANLWHRAKPTTPAGGKRRLLLLSYYPTWLKRNYYGVQPVDGLTHALVNDADQETLELIGKAGYM